MAARISVQELASMQAADSVLIAHVPSFSLLADGGFLVAGTKSWLALRVDGVPAMRVRHSRS